MFRETFSYRFKTDKQWKRHLISFSEHYLKDSSYVDSFEDIESRLESDFDRAIEEGSISVVSKDIGRIPFYFEFGSVETKSGRPVFFDYYLVVRIVGDLPEDLNRGIIVSDLGGYVSGVDSNIPLYPNFKEDKIVEFLGYDF